MAHVRHEGRDRDHPRRYLSGLSGPDRDLRARPPREVRVSTMVNTTMTTTMTVLGRVACSTSLNNDRSSRHCQRRGQLDRVLPFGMSVLSTGARRSRDRGPRRTRGWTTGAERERHAQLTGTSAHMRAQHAGFFRACWAGRFRRSR
jgi:hypothetical protein